MEDTEDNSGWSIVKSLDIEFETWLSKLDFLFHRVERGFEIYLPIEVNIQLTS